MTARSRPLRGVLLILAVSTSSACGFGGGGITPVRTAFNRGVYHYSTGEYDHVGSCDCWSDEAGTIEYFTPPGGAYFLVVSECGPVISSSGRDSEGLERPSPVAGCP